MGNVLSIMLSYKLYKDHAEKSRCCKKRKYSDFLLDCRDFLKNENTEKINDFQMHKIE
jgi:hypothetical protein